MPPMPAPKQPTGPKNIDTQGVPTQRSAKRADAGATPASTATSPAKLESSPPSKSPKGSKSSERAATKKTAPAERAAPSAGAPPRATTDATVAPADAQVTTSATATPLARPEPPLSPATNPVIAVKGTPVVPSSRAAAPFAPRGTDSQPPIPSSVAVSLRSDEMDRDRLGPPSMHPRMSVRPANYLTKYDLPMDKESLKLGVANHVEYTQGKDEFSATQLDYYMAAAYATRDRLFDRWNKTQQTYYRKDQRRVYYLSMEFLLGRLFEESLSNLGIRDKMEACLSDLGLDSATLAEAEYDAGLGNGGLGRLAACLLDSMATVGLPGMGYGIRYEYGIFEQQIVEGRQVERADNWLRYGNPWEVARPEQRYLVRLGGRVLEELDHVGRNTFHWVDTEDVWAMAYDILVPGYGNDVVNTLRLWSARATRGFQFSYFNDGDYIKAVEAKDATENISRVLYPNDMVAQGRELRLKQEYF